ncbi:MAG: hypothetical protein ACR2FX_07960 [Chthoniobacterales bacterium]
MRIFFSICLVIVTFAGVYIFRNRQKFLARDPQVKGDYYGARNLRLCR